MEFDEDLSLLICSANIGNAEPTPESFAAWIPEDGNIIESSSLPGNDSNNTKKPKKYHLIIVGMQEAAFTNKKKKMSETNRSDSIDETSGRSASATTENGEEFQKKHKIVRKVDKLMLVMRGLTAQETHRAPTMRTKSQRNLPDSDFEIKRTSFAGLVTSSQYDTSVFASLFGDRCPSYSLVCCNMRGEMRLWVLCLKELRDEVEEVYVAGENTGIGSVLANKGGIIATLTIRSTRFSFLTCHLEAHEGITHYNNRNKNLYDIFRGAKPHPDYYIMDASIYSHHMFVCGDLNYRTRFASPSDESRSSITAVTNKMRKSKEDGEPDNGSGYTQASKLVEEEKWSELYAADELCMALKKKECLVGFETLPCNFNPTFKVDREEGYVYNAKRTPSYTDRILWKSTDAMKGTVTPTVYEPCPDFITSDHKPIRGAFSVQLNKGDSTPLEPANENGEQIHLLISDIKCTNLPIMDSELMGGLSDPYILFVSSPKELTWEDKAWPSTKVMYRNLNPTWDEGIHLRLKHKGRIESDYDLSGDMLYIVVMDYDQASGDDVIGAVALSVKDLCSSIEFTKPDRRATISFHNKIGLQETIVSQPILCNGRENGMLECKITSAYLPPGEVKSFLKTAGNVRKAKFRNVKDRFLAMLKC